ncbi:hypothetical protein [uncultured Tateyamaria sp.]|uniref:hypothetical protein n=1 Tax=uncultured Tateyamaria sp. TaxID=455651 RepID=UPI00261405E0|nr:hypothetical protein [uncultured Tateyamaria sp.]
MQLLKRLFKGKPKPEKNEQLVLVFVPALVAILKAAEDDKGSPLEEKEVLTIRDKATCMAVSMPYAVALEEQRGYPDISAETVWEDWKVLRNQFRD